MENRRNLKNQTTIWNPGLIKFTSLFEYLCTAHWMAHSIWPIATINLGPGGAARRRLRGRPRERSRKPFDHVNLIRYPDKSLFLLFRRISMDIWLCHGISVNIYGHLIWEICRIPPPLQNRQIMLWSPGGHARWMNEERNRICMVAHPSGCNNKATNY